MSIHLSSERGRAAAIALAFLLAAMSVAAQEPDKPDGTPPTLAESIADAEAVVHGTVSSVQYRQSTGDERVPYTFVTYKIGDALRGRVDGDSLTLRFVGGSDGQGRFLTVSGVPQFSVGDEDLLLVRDNGGSDCPLVGCEDGRLRIYRGHVYGAHGQAVVGIDKGRLLYGTEVQTELLKVTVPAPSFDELIKNPDVARQVRVLSRESSMDDLRRRYEQEAPKTIEYAVHAGQDQRRRDALVGEGDVEVHVDEPERQRRPAVAFDQVRQWLVDEIRRLPEPRETAAVASVDPDTPFKAPTLTASRPPRLRSDPLQTSPTRAEETAEERREREALQQQEFNPVIRDRQDR